MYSIWGRLRSYKPAASAQHCLCSPDPVQFQNSFAPLPVEQLLQPCAYPGVHLLLHPPTPPNRCPQKSSQGLPHRTLVHP